ncbi:MAG: hypothetical protein ABR915_17950 [Thermoguttaceae bacterium]
MASPVATPRMKYEGPPPAPARYEVFIEGRIRDTRRQVKTVDIATGLMVLGAGTLAFLLAVAVLDQWVLEGGLGFSARLGLWLLGVAAAGTYFWRQVLPPLVNRINPIYAAQTIEQSRPSLKNSLINFLLFRGHRQEMPAGVYNALQQRAAVDLSQTNVEAAVDRGRVIPRACLLAGLVVAMAVYLAVSPKNPLVSAARVLWPWSHLAAPTRVAIEDLRPGDVTAFFGDSVEVSAHVRGLRDGEAVTLLARTADEESVDQPIPMGSLGEGNRYQCALPPGIEGLKQDMIYRLEAGDAASQPFRIEVQVAPTIGVDRVDYHYPRYIGRKDETLRGQGDLRAIEGTRVTLHATANQDIREAKIDLNCAGLRSLAMQTAGKTASGQFTLGFDSDGRPLVDSYQILFTDTGGRTNRRPVRYRVEVIRDLPPEVQIVRPREEEVDVPADGRLPIRVRAEDPDFALRQVSLAAEREGRRLAIPPLMSQMEPQDPWQGPFEKEYAFQPAVLGLKAGDRIKYWAEADDNKEPTSNHVETHARFLHVTAPEGSQSPQAGPQPHRAEHAPQDSMSPRQDRPESPDQRSPKADQGQGGQSPEEPAGEKPQPGAEKKPDREEPTSPDEKKPDTAGPDANPQDDSPQGGRQSGASSPSPSGENQPDKSNLALDVQQSQEPIDPETQPGDAMKKMLDHRQKDQSGSQDQQPNQSGTAGQSGQQQPGNQSQGQKPDAGSPQPGSQNSQGQKPDAGSPQPGSQQGQGQKSPGQQAGQDSAGGQPNAQSKQSSGAANSGQGGQPGQQKKQGMQPGGETPGQDSAGGQPKTQEKQPGGGEKDSQSGGPSGDQKTPDKQSGPQQSGQDSGGGQSKTQDKQSSAQEPGGNQGGQPADQKPQDKQSGVQPSGGQNPMGNLLQPKPDQEAPSKGGSGESGGQPKPENKTGGGQQDGSQASSGQDPKQPQPSAGKSNPSSAGTQSDQPRQQDGSKHGDVAPNSQGAPAPQAGNQAGQHSPGGKTPGQPQSPESSPTISPKPSNNTTSDTAGDRSASGAPGGGQQGHKSGKGNPGSSTPSDEGGPSGERGPGGEQTKSSNQKGSAAAPTASGEGQRREQPGAEGPLSKSDHPPNESAEGTAARDEPSSGGQAGSNSSDQPGSRGSGQPTGGGRPGNSAEVTASGNAQDRGEDAANLEFTKKQVDLALEHLKDQLAKEKPGLLKELGWTRQEAQQFLDNWQRRVAAAQESGPEGAAARRSLDRALKNLGLRPRDTLVRGGRTTPDDVRNLRDAGQSDPPRDWQDAVEAYSRALKSHRGGEK